MGARNEGSGISVYDRQQTIVFEHIDSDLILHLVLDCALS